MSIAEKVSAMIEEALAESEEQSSAAKQIGKNIEGISNVTQKIAAGVQRIARTPRRFKPADSEFTRIDFKVLTCNDSNSNVHN